jgi:ABC-type branched-subunit amino acid transport system ATPase component
VAAVDGVSISVKRGSVTAVIGPNGSGKTTMLNAISGFVPYSGRVWALGQELTAKPAYRRVAIGVGRTFQNPTVTNEWRVRDILEVGLSHRDPRSALKALFRPQWTARQEAEISAAIDHTLSTVGIDPALQGAFMGSLSHGQAKLVDIARALMSEPKLLLLDEPTSGVAESDLPSIAQVISSLRDRGVSVLLVEHNVDFIRSLADEAVVLSRGGLLTTGTPAGVLSQPEVIAVYMGTRAGEG